MILGGIARISEIAARAAVNRLVAQPWNKWRGPASSRGGAVYAAKVCCRAIDGEHDVIG